MPKKKTAKPETEPTPAAEPGAEIVFPTRPRFTLETLQEIHIATGDGESTIAAYTHLHNGAPTTKYVVFSDLTHAEREAALEFILRYSGAAAIRRKGKPRGRSAPRQRRARQPKPLTDAERDSLDNFDLEGALDELAKENFDFDIPDDAYDFDAVDPEAAEGGEIEGEDAKP